MNDARPERRIPLPVVIRRLFRAALAMLCVCLLAAVVLIGNRYLANRRLMSLVEPPPPKTVFDASIGFTGARTEWLEQCVGPQHAQALLCRPNYFAVHQQDYLPDSTVLEVLQASSGLKTVFVHRRNLPDGSLEAVATRHLVETFHFEVPAIWPDDARWLRQMTRLKQVGVKLTSHVPSDNDWSWLKDLANLQKAIFEILDATDNDVLAIADCPATQILTLSGDGISDGALSRLSDLPVLQYLTLKGSQIRLHFPNGRRLPLSLIGLRLDSVDLDEASLAAMSGIQELTIVGCNFGDSQIPWLARLPLLRQLELTDLKNLSDDGLKGLDQCQKLGAIRISGCGTTPAGLIPLEALSNLNLVEFEGVKILRDFRDANSVLTPDNVADFLEKQRQIQNRMHNIR